MPALSKIPKISQIWEKNFQAISSLWTYLPACSTNARVIFLVISSNRKGQIWKYSRKGDFCYHAGPIENSKNQPDLVKKIFKRISIYGLISLPDVLMPEWYSYHFKQQKPDLEIFLKIRFLPPCRPYRKFQKSARFGQKIFQPIKLSPWLIYNAWVIFLSFQATKARFGNISEN